MNPADAQVKDRERRTVSSALWAAWGDALGFITELADETGVRCRLNGRSLSEPVAWKRRVGGKFGVEVVLPAGCYSDDTQLRLATGRAIHNRGFDIEAFARVELPVWLAYALGGGTATKTAAANLAKSGAPWFGNTYSGWLDAGGNGVAMRIQPHVWAAPHPCSVGPHLIDVITNGVTTHGHPRALVGAVLHAVTLGAALEKSQVPSVESWPELLEMTLQSSKLVDEHPHLASFWRPIWESAASVSLDEAWQHTTDECRELLDKAATFVEAIGRENQESGSTSGNGAYDALVASLELRDPSRRGSGTATVVAAMVLAAALPHDPAAAALVPAQALGTDTDTIATMAAGIVGASTDIGFPAPVLDSSYHNAEAARLADIASGISVTSFSYPDLLEWIPPRTQLDAVGLDEGRPALAGLGWLLPVESAPPTTRRETAWQWMQSDFGASFLVKRRESPKALPDGNRPQRRTRSIDATPASATDVESMPDKLALSAGTGERSTSTGSHRRGPHNGLSQTTPSDTVANQEHDRPPADIDSMLAWVIKHGLSDRNIGYAVRRIVEVGTVEQMIALVTALRAEMRRAPSTRPHQRDY